MAAAQQHTAPIPLATLQQHGRIRFLHPGYSAPTNELLCLPRVDPLVLESVTTFGVRYKTALVACQIIANNSFTIGRLTLDQAGQQPVDLGLDGILTEGIYYFFVGDGPEQYPIVPSFQDWEFPCGRVPDSWPALLPSEPTRRCSITNFSGPLERAHLVPHEEEAWFRRNGMWANGRTRTIDGPGNILSLRRDLHACFDNRLFVIVPKAFAPSSRSPQYVVHFIHQDATAAEYWPTCHHALVQNLDLDSREYLFARFAWAILFLAKPFITAGCPRRVVVRVGKEGEVRYEEMVLSGAKLISSYGDGGSRGSKPSRKRAKTDSTMEEDEDLSESSSEGWDPDNPWDEGWGEERRRELHSSDETAADAGSQLRADVERELSDTLTKVPPTSQV